MSYICHLHSEGFFFVEISLNFKCFERIFCSEETFPVVYSSFTKLPLLQTEIFLERVGPKCFLRTSFFYLYAAYLLKT